MYDYKKLSEQVKLAKEAKQEEVKQQEELLKEAKELGINVDDFTKKSQESTNGKEKEDEKRNETNTFQTEDLTKAIVEGVTKAMESTSKTEESKEEIVPVYG